jgi:hypothetical protein
MIWFILFYIYFWIFFLFIYFFIYLFLFSTKKDAASLAESLINSLTIYHNTLSEYTLSITNNINLISENDKILLINYLQLDTKLLNELILKCETISKQGVIKNLIFGKIKN